jgi:hypothetical protein
VRDAAIHRVSRYTVYGCGTVTVVQWIATPARGSRRQGWCGCVVFVIARRERSEGRGNPSCLGKNRGVCDSLTEDQWIATGF